VEKLTTGAALAVRGTIGESKPVNQGVSVSFLTHIRLCEGQHRLVVGMHESVACGKSGHEGVFSMEPQWWNIRRNSHSGGTFVATVVVMLQLIP
jgi:hypothetical protein